MKITLESTTKIVRLDGINCRIWEGHTARGIAVHAYIPRVAVAKGLPVAQYHEFEMELREQREPSPELRAIPLSMIL